MSNIAGWGSLVGNSIGALDSLDGEMSGFGTFASGAGQGISAGAALGPWGMLAGGAIGGIASLLTKKKKDKEMDAQKKAALELRAKEDLSIRQNAQADLNSRFNVKGMDVPGFYSAGGKVPKSYLAEGGETIQHPFDLPLTLNGDLNELSSDMSEIVGPSHEHPSGGVMMKGGERIFSDRIPVSKKAVKYFKKNI